MRVWLLLASLFLAQGDAQSVQRVVAAERAFAAAAAEQGWRDAALAFAAPDALVLGGAPSDLSAPALPAHAAFETLPLSQLPVAMREIWDPVTGQISADGTIAWMVGARATLSLTIRGLASQGAFFRVWRRQTDGTWRVWLFDEVRFPAVWQTDATFSAAPQADEAADGAPDETLADAERNVAGGGIAWARRLSIDVRLHRSGVSPLRGRAAVTDWAATNWRDGTYEATAAEAASSGDLGIAFGRYRQDSGRERGTWARAWQRDVGGRWRIVFETSHAVRPADR